MSPVLPVWPRCFQWPLVRLWTGCLVGCLLAIPALAGDFEKSTTYFANVYGLPKTTRTVSAHVFRRAGETVAVKGNFSVRKYLGPDLEIEAVFVLPQLTLAGVALRRPGSWTYAERDESFAAYGSRWRQLNGVFWISSTGVGATYDGSAFYFVSPEIAGTMEETEKAPDG
jgi:hypothetical protein